MTINREYGVIRRHIWSSNQIDHRPYSGVAIEKDFRLYHTPKYELLGSSFDKAGVIAGLAVSLAKNRLGETEVIVAPGVALDSSSKLIVLASNKGWGYIPDKTEASELGENGFTIPQSALSKYKNKTVILSIKYDERSEGTGEYTEVELAPRFELTPVEMSEIESTFRGDAVALAAINVDADGFPASISHGDSISFGESSYQRQLVGQSIGSIKIMRSETNRVENQVFQVKAGEIRPAKDGTGIEVDCILRVKDIVFIEDDIEDDTTPSKLNS